MCTIRLEGMNEGINEETYVGMNAGMKECMKNCMKESMKESMEECMKEKVNLNIRFHPERILSENQRESLSPLSRGLAIRLGWDLNS